MQFEQGIVLSEEEAEERQFEKDRLNYEKEEASGILQKFKDRGGCSNSRSFRLYN